jgi:hypothetical protein
LHYGCKFTQHIIGWGDSLVKVQPLPPYGFLKKPEQARDFLVYVEFSELTAAGLTKTP